MKSKKIIGLIVFVFVIILSIAIYMFFAQSVIEKQTWELLTASKIGEPFPVVAHKIGMDVSDDKYFIQSKEVELICVAEDGKLTLTDKTNNKVYEGTYKVNIRWNRWKFFSLRGQTYNCTIDGKECTANISYKLMDFWNADTLVIQIDGYTLTFGKK